MSVSASAPGKLVLLGEYAVLEGAPALVVATRERARARVEPLSEGRSRLRARPLLDRPIEFDWAADGGLRWQTDLSDSERARLAWAGALLEALAARGWWPSGPLAVELDSRDFHAADGSKLGLGSSAAVTVALAGAAAALAAPGAAPSLPELVALHRSLQQGRGSGLDVAASLLGGSLCYRLDQGEIDARPVTLPPGFALLALASGTSVSTPAALERLHAWAEAHPQDWSALRAALVAAAERGAAALAEGAAALTQAVDGFALQLAQLERCTGLPVFGSGHSEPARLAQDCEVVYKPSGAGGDLGIAASPVGARIATLRRRATAAGIQWLDLDGQAAGLEVLAPATTQASA